MPILLAHAEPLPGEVVPLHAFPRAVEQLREPCHVPDGLTDWSIIYLQYYIDRLIDAATFLHYFPLPNPDSLTAIAHCLINHLR